MKKDRTSMLMPKLSELIPGYIYWVIYLLLLGELLVWLLPELGVDVSTAKGNSLLQLSYMVINFIAVLLIFHRFLLASIRDMKGKIKRTILSVLLGFGIYYTLAWQVTLIFALFELTPQNLNQESVDLLLNETPWQMLLCTIFFAPFVEELLFRGLFFAPLYRKIPILAYVVSVLLFAAIHVTGAIGVLPWGEILLCLVQYLPAGIALGIVYQRTENIFGPMLLHFAINLLASAASFGQ